MAEAPGPCPSPGCLPAAPAGEKKRPHNPPKRGFGACRQSRHVFDCIPVKGDKIKLESHQCFFRPALLPFSPRFFRFTVSIWTAVAAGSAGAVFTAGILWVRLQLAFVLSQREERGLAITEPL